MTLRIIGVLMWKHSWVRLRRYIHTPVEVLSTIVLFALLFAFKNTLLSLPDEILNNNTTFLNTKEFRRSQLARPWRVLYAPDNNKTNKLMDDVGHQLCIKRLNSSALRTSSRGHCGFSASSDIDHWLDKLNTNDAVVIFDNLDQEAWPQNLSYTIRMRGTHLANNEVRGIGLRRAAPAPKEYGNMYHQVMNLQWAVDTSFIHMLTGRNVSQTLSVQEFPLSNPPGMIALILICYLLKLATYSALFLVFVFLMTRLIEERCSGIQELMKMAGVSTNLLGISHFLNTLPAGVVFSVVGALLMKVTSRPLLPASDGFLIAIMLFLYFVSIIAQAFPCSYVVQENHYTVPISVGMFMLLYIPLAIVSKYKFTGVALFFVGLLPHVPISWLWHIIAGEEILGPGLSFSKLFTTKTNDHGSVAMGAACLVLQALLMFALTWYLTRVCPGKYGIPRPWNFICRKRFWTKKEETVLLAREDQQDRPKESQYFEEEPKGAEIGIKVENVSKVFIKQTVLDNVSMNVYKGEITVLLGHNGAGKTTLMSIITGVIRATGGRVLVNGMDITKAGDKVRTQMGLCPQHNLFFPDLTVVQHPMFFIMLKGGSYKGSRGKSLDILERLHIKDKAGMYSSTLSGGMKRRLQLACALAGSASVLVLDEPTSGLDVETRRELWDLLLSLRGDHTVLLTTHIMEEADALGDRVAALHQGQLRCFATTMFLKKAIGTGYRLTLTTKEQPQEAAITDLVTSHVPGATLKEQTMNSLSYSLPASASGNFPRLFSALEDKKSELGIESIGVGASTLEEVFLKLCSNTDTPLTEDKESTRTAPVYNKITGRALYWRQFKVLMLRQFRFTWDRKFCFCISQIILPIVMIGLVTSTCNNEPVKSSEGIALDMSLYSEYPERRVLCSVPAGVRLRALNDVWPNVSFTEEPDMTRAVLRAREEDPKDYNKYIAGMEINDTHAKALFTTTVRHAAPVSVNLLSNALATRYLERADGRTFRTRFEPIQTGKRRQLGSQGKGQEQEKNSRLAQPKSLDNILFYSVAIACVLCSALLNSASLLCKERDSGARHIHTMSGCPVSVHWAASLVFDTLMITMIMAVTVAVSAAIFENDNTINSTDVILSMMLVLFVGSFAFLALVYFVCCYCNVTTASCILIAIIVFFGVVTGSTEAALNTSNENVKMNFIEILFLQVSNIMPPHVLTRTLAELLYCARLNEFCDLNRKQCPNLITKEKGFDAKKCCSGGTHSCYMCMEQYAPVLGLIILIIHFIVFMALVILTELGILNVLAERTCNSGYRPAGKVAPDEVVRAETAYVEHEIAQPKQTLQQSGNVMLVHNLHKKYLGGIVRKPCLAVQGINFSVKIGECFGLLGVNGAGKSTTFKMLTAEECPTRGKIYANGFYSHERGPYLRTLGYCPQFFGLDDFLTGRQNLELLLILRGLDDKAIREESISWIQVVGLEKYSDQPVQGYSGGCARRLAAAAALSTGAPLTMLDEPTAGVDVSARRRVWSALQRGLALERAVIITSHSLDEMEALCARIAIMSRGEVRALGTPSELRARFGVGHAVIIKLKHTPPEPKQDDQKVEETPMSDVDRFKEAMQQKFNCTLKDAHKTMLHYHINETMRYSQLFSELEELRSAHSTLVEDYAVTETTLEEVFLSFAREQQQQPNPAPVAANSKLPAKK